MTCIEYRGNLNSVGYGRFKIKGKRLLAHRVAYEKAHGPIPDGLIVRHRCDNRACINPDHLEVGTYSDNVQDMLSRGRGNPPIGERNGMAKLTDDQVAHVRTLWPGKGLTQAQIAQDFGVSASLISMICNQKTRSSERSVQL